MSSPPPRRLATAQTLAQGRRRHPLRPSLQRVQQRLMQNVANPKVAFGLGLTDVAQAMKLKKIFVKLKLLPRGDLRPAFQGVSFGSGAEETRRMEHVLNELARTGTARYVDLAELFNFEELEEEAFSLDPERRSGAGHTATPSASANSGKEDRDETESEDEEQDKSSVRVLLIASAGCGKTTLMTKYCPMQWARGMLWADKFDLVIAKEFRYEETRRIAGVEDLLGGWKWIGIASSEDQQYVLDFVMDNPERVCLILDGLDETKLSKCSEYLQKVICGEELCGIHLVLTTRATEDAFRLSGSYPFNRRVELVGFLPIDVPEYVKRVLEGDLAEKLITEMEKNPFIHGVMCTPYFAASICELYRWRNQVPRCLSDVFELMLLRIAERRSEKSIATWESVGEDVKKQMMDLGECAFRMLVAQHLVFSDEDLSAISLSEEAVGLGLLVACERDSVALQRQWRFAHLSLQESLSAMFIAHCSDMYPRKIVRLVEALGPMSGHLEIFWRLLGAQLSPECMNHLVGALLLCDHTPMAERELESLLFNRETFPEPLLDVLKSQFSQDALDRLAGRLLNGLVVGSGSLAVENEIQRSRKTSNADFLKTLLEVWRRCCPEANVGLLLEHISDLDASTAEKCSSAIGFGAASTRYDVLPPISKLTGHGFGDDWPRVMRVFHCYAEFAQHNEASGKMKNIHLPHLADFFASNTFYVNSTTIYAKDVFAFEQVLQHHARDIVKLRIAAISSMEPHLLRVLRLLPSCDQVQELCFQGFFDTVDEDELDWLPQLVKKNAASLTHIWGTVHRPASTAGGVCFWSSLNDCPRLKFLSIEAGMLQPAILREASIGVWDALEKVALDTRALKADEIEQLLSCLTQSPNLNEARLDAIRFPCLSYLAAALQHWPQLQILEISFTGMGDLSEEVCDEFLSAVHEHAWLTDLTIIVYAFQVSPHFTMNDLQLKRLTTSDSYPGKVHVDLSIIGR